LGDLRVNKLADILVNYSIAVKPGDWVLIRGQPVSLPLVDQVARHVLRAGGNPSIFMSTDDLRSAMLEEASMEQLAWISPVDRLVNEEVDAIISIWATENTRAMSGADHAKLRHYQASHSEISKIFMDRMSDYSLRWVGTQFPNQAHAQEANMSLAQFEDFVYGAAYADQPDPVQRWHQMHDMQQQLVEWLKGKKRLEVRGPNVDLTLSIEGRDFINSDGHRNMPSGEIYTSPQEQSAEGWIKFTYPAIYMGQEVEGVTLTFNEGKVVEASAEKNEALLLSQLDVDAGARYLGEFAIGTNYAIQQFTKNTLFDEKIGGTIHLALGRGFKEIGGQNESAVHWDMVCDMRQESEIVADGVLFYKDGRFQDLPG